MSTTLSRPVLPLTFTRNCLALSSQRDKECVRGTGPQDTTGPQLVDVSGSKRWRKARATTCAMYKNT